MLPLTALFCLLLTIGYHTHCNCGCATASTNNMQLGNCSNLERHIQQATATICDILYFPHRLPSWLPYCNWGFTSIISFTSITKSNLSTPLFTISTTYLLRNLLSVEKLRTEGSQQSSGSLHSASTRINKDPEQCPLLDTDSEDEDWPEILTDSRQYNPECTPKQPGTLPYFIPLLWLTELSAALDTWQGSCENNPDLIPGLLVC